MCDQLVPILKGLKKEINWNYKYPLLFSYIRHGKFNDSDLYEICNDNTIFGIIKEYRKQYQRKEYFNNPIYDFVGVTTLFTFHWSITIETINFVKQLCKDEKNVMIGGIMSSLVATEIEKETEIKPFIGQLSKPGIIDKDNTEIIDEMPLDYSILDEIDYKYPASDAYFAYMTRGCVNKCEFCAVPVLEPTYRPYITLEKTIDEAKIFGERRNLLLLDNNVLASPCFNKIIDEINRCGFAKGATYIPSNRYALAIKNLREQNNIRANTRVCVELYEKLRQKLVKLANYEKTESEKNLTMHRKTCISI
jgi:hypothetical protein